MSMGDESDIMATSNEVLTVLRAAYPDRPSEALAVAAVTLGRVCLLLNVGEDDAIALLRDVLTERSPG